MRRQQGFNTRFFYFGRALFFAASMLYLVACGRSYTSAPAPLNQNDPLGLGNNNTGTGTVDNPPPITSSNPVCGNLYCESGETASSCPADCSSSSTQNYSCTLSLASGSPIATQAPQAPVPVQYLLAISPSISSVPQPQIVSVPTGAFTASSLVANGSNVTVTGNFNVTGSITLQATTNINGQIVSCQATATVTQAATPSMVVNRFDRASPPDIFYATSNAGPGGYNMAGNMFKVFTQAPPASFCQAIPLNQCLLPRSPASVNFLSQAANCGGYPMVSQLGFTCSSNVSGTTPLYRLTNGIDHRYYTTASSQDVQVLTSQGWTYEGVIGYAPLQ